VPHLFSYFYAEAEINTVTPKTNIKTDTFEKRHGTYSVNTDEKRMIIGTKRPPESCSNANKSKIVFSKPVKIT
jgi:hypothetical protein